MTAVQAAGLVDTLKGPGPFTVFAPTDEAFAKIPKGHARWFAGGQGGTDQGADLPRCARQVMAKDVKAGKVKTVQGQELTVSTNMGDGGPVQGDRHRRCRKQMV